MMQSTKTYVYVHTWNKNAFMCTLVPAAAAGRVRAVSAAPSPPPRAGSGSAGPGRPTRFDFASDSVKLGQVTGTERFRATRAGRRLGDEC